MTREEAMLWMRVLKHSKINWVGEKAEEEDIIKACEEAEQEVFDIAIESLQKDIERHEMVIRASERHLGIVRSKDCRHRDLFSCPLADNDFQKDDDFCSWGVKK